jgi:hypothetical protein
MTLTLDWIMTIPTRKRRWFRLTPDRLILGLLAVEGLLWLSNWLCWPTWQKGYAVLATAATVGVVLLAMFLWFVAALAFRLRFQFSLRSLLILSVVVALPSGWMAAEAKQARRQSVMVAKVLALGGSVGDEWWFGLYVAGEERGWARKFFGDEFFHDATKLGFDGAALDDERLARLCNIDGMETAPYLWIEGTKISDAGLGALRRLAGLRTLGLRGSAITDAGLEHVKALGTLRFLDVSDAKVTDSGVKRLQESLPECRIQR